VRRGDPCRVRGRGWEIRPACPVTASGCTAPRPDLRNPYVQESQIGGPPSGRGAAWYYAVTTPGGPCRTAWRGAAIPYHRGEAAGRETGGRVAALTVDGGAQFRRDGTIPALGPGLRAAVGDARRAAFSGLCAVDAQWRNSSGPARRPTVSGRVPAPIPPARPAWRSGSDQRTRRPDGAAKPCAHPLARLPGSHPDYGGRRPCRAAPASSRHTCERTATRRE
jgi:hypothetical protein